MTQALLGLTLLALSLSLGFVLLMIIFKGIDLLERQQRLYQRIQHAESA